jgi:ectoine hydroxylase-related dioxygenase (phytanoyl-CoA dioxygenase family)
MALTARRPKAWFNEDDCDLDAFRAIVEQATDPADYPLSAGIERGVVIYDSSRLREASSTLAGRKDVQTELADVFAEGPGIAVFKEAFADDGVMDRATAAFEALVTAQRGAGEITGDHFGKPGINDRVWNALEKLALAEPGTFADYYANEIVALASEAWLGRGYQITSQVNVVNPGGQAQVSHRDYHLGFMSFDEAAAFPAQVHRLSPALTLQGAVAHCDMPVETGPTMYLPHSQKFGPGYLAWWREDFRAYFVEHFVQLPLAKGDAVFFNPAVFHGAGTNRSADVKRMGNLLQVSSAFGRAMETVDREAMVNAVFPVLLERQAEGASPAWLDTVIAACAEGYAFPTNLDHDSPIDGLAPPSQADIVRRAVHEAWTVETLQRELRALAARRVS